MQYGHQRREQVSVDDVLAMTATAAVMHAAFIITPLQKRRDESIETRIYRNTPVHIVNAQRLRFSC